MADPSGGLIALAVLALYPAAAFAGVMWHAATEGRRLATARRDWAKLAARRGLVGGETPIAGGAWQLSFSGRLGGRAITLSAQTSNPTQGWTHLLAHLHPPLDLGLHASTEGPPLPIPGTVSPLERATRRLGIAADEPERAGALFDLDLNRRLKELPDGWTLTDSGLLHRVSTFVTDPRSLEGLLSRLMETCDAVDRGRARVGPPWALREDAAQWRRFAQERGLEVMTAPLAMAGTIEGITVSAFARRTDRRTYGLGAEARFREPLGGAVGLVPTAPGAMAPWLGISPRDLGGEDWLLGDPVFDGTFLVRSRDPSRLPRLLDPDLRARLLRIHERTPLVLDDLGVRVAAERLPSPAEVPALLVSLSRLAGEIEATVRGGGSPYR